MTDDPTRKAAKNEPNLVEQVGAKAARKLKAQRSTTRGVWFGLGMMGLIGWSIAVPTLLGVALGRWLDQRSSDGRSWTVALLMAGLTLGCFNAWHWVVKESKEIRNEQEDDDA